MYLIHPCGVGDWQQVLEPTLIEGGPFLGTVCRVGASEAPKVSTGTPPGITRFITTCQHGILAGDFFVPINREDFYHRERRAHREKIKQIKIFRESG